MHVFYLPDIKSGIVNLDETESKHCTRVLRLKTGDEVCLVDGIGNFFHARLINEHQKACSLEIFKTIPEYGKRNYRLVMAVSPLKNTDRFEWFLEKATETGIDMIIPVLCEHTERKGINTDRFEKIITSAVKQSVKAYHPVLSEMKKFREIINMDFSGDKFIATCEDLNNKLLKDMVIPSKDTMVLIGPEGDFSPDELKLALQNGFQPVSLGNSRFRTETAAVLACHTVYLANNCP